MDFAFKKKNYILLITGLVFIFSGLLLMIGGGSEDPEKFSYENFNFQRLTLAPRVIFLTLLILVLGHYLQLVYLISLNR